MKVICNGDPETHKCESRKCKHRLPHKPVDGCDVMSHNWGRTWCQWPGTQSMMDMGEDGTCVMCKPPDVVVAEKKVQKDRWSKHMAEIGHREAVERNQADSPCKHCKSYGENGAGEQPCVGCCWSYESRFEVIDSPPTSTEGGK